MKRINDKLYVILAVIIFALMLIVTFIQTEHLASFYYRDFIEYWSAFQIFIKNGSIYQPREVLDIQTLIDSRKEPLMMWNPPWLLVLFSPVLAFDINTSYIIWQLLSIFISILGILIIDKKLQTNSLLKLVVLLSFPPLFYCIQLGQLGVFLSFGVLLSYLGFKRNSNLLIAISLIILSLKPHLFWLLLVFITINIYIEKNYRLIKIFVSLFTPLILITYLINNNSLEDWILSILQPTSSQIAANVNDWVCPSLPSILSYFLVSNNNLRNALFLLFFGLSTYLIYKNQLYKKTKEIFETLPYLSIMLIISAWLSPFGWYFDLAIAGFGYLALVNPILSTSKGYQFGMLFILINFIANCVIVPKTTYQHEMWWFYPFLLVFWVILFKLSPKNDVK